MLWYLCNSNDDQLATQVGTFAAGFQTRFATPSFTEEETTQLLDPKNLIDNTSKSLNPEGNFYMLSELTTANELFKTRLFVRLKDFKLLTSLSVLPLDKIEKDMWEEFWRMYCVLNC